MTEYYERYKPFPLREGQTVDFHCEHEMCDLSLRFDHGHFINHYGNTYVLEGNNMLFVCDMGYSPANQQSTVTCTKNGWSPAPRCILH
ncbi:hypothetical protein E2320_010585 [Naja naja]|nr:hypothetical protein E2320_010585 [Naja naja]